MLGRLLARLLFAGKLNPVQVIQLDPDSRYLAVVSLPDRLSMAAFERFQVQHKAVFDPFFGENKCSLVIVEGGAKLDFYQFKEKTDGRD